MFRKKKERHPHSYTEYLRFQNYFPEIVWRLMEILVSLHIYLPSKAELAKVDYIIYNKVWYGIDKIL